MRVAMVSQLQPFYFVEQDPNGEYAARPEIVGRLSVAVMWQRIENPLAAIYYISGPPPMLKAIARDLSDHSIRADMIRTDAWE